MEELKGTKECSIRSFIFCYNNICLIYKDIKYKASYWLQELKLNKLRGIKEQDRLYKLD